MALNTYTTKDGHTAIEPCHRCGMVIPNWCECQFKLESRDGPIMYDNGIDVSRWYDCRFCGNTLEPVNSEDICESCEQWLEGCWGDEV